MYKTFDKFLQQEQIIKKSRFIVLGDYVDSEKSATIWLKNIKEKFYDARHIAYAYRVINNGQVFQKSSDDGEPSGTAGKPILNVIINDDLINVVIAVVRYFGGIKLGAGGLTRAYGGSAKLLKPFYVDKLQELEFQTDICNGDRLFKYLNNHNIKYDKQFNDKLYVKIYANDFEKIKADLDFIDFNK